MDFKLQIVVQTDSYNKGFLMPFRDSNHTPNVESVVRIFEIKEGKAAEEYYREKKSQEGLFTTTTINIIHVEK